VMWRVCARAQGRLVQQHTLEKDELLQMIRFGADAIFRKEGDNTITDEVRFVCVCDLV
jgi:hypothetical protein